MANQESQKMATDTIREVQKYVYDSSVSRRGLSCQDRICLTKTTQKGTCTTKHEVLAYELQNIGCQILYLTYPFFWQENLANCPSELQNLMETMPRQNHLALGVFVDQQLKVVDVTWDPSLKKSGFTVPEIRQNIDNTPIAVTPFCQPIVHRTVEERAIYLQQNWPEAQKNPEIRQFYSCLNNWLIQLRQSQSNEI